MTRPRSQVRLFKPKTIFDAVWKVFTTGQFVIPDQAICYSRTGTCHSGLDPESTTALTPLDIYENFTRLRVKLEMISGAEGETFTSRYLGNIGKS